MKHNRTGKHRRGHGQPKKKWRPPISKTIEVTKHVVETTWIPQTPIQYMAQVLQILEDSGYDIWEDD